jgi:flagellar protein FlaJ
MAAILPFSFLPQKLVLRLSKNLLGAQKFFSALFPGIKDDLVQAGFPVSAREYVAASLFAAIANAVIISVVMLALEVATKASLLHYALLFAVIVFAATFATCVFYPRIVAVRKARALNIHLIPAIRQLVIELKSGVPLFNAMNSICEGYGEVSVLFRKTVQWIDAGTPDVDAIMDAAQETPSLQLRKALWQISNALKVGSDVGNALDALAQSLEKERIEEIKRYGQELAPWMMIYMLAAIILPSMGVAMLIVLASFFDIAVPNIALAGALVFIAGFQIFFANFVSTRRPAVAV